MPRDTLPSDEVVSWPRQSVWWFDIGLQDYQSVWDFQESLFSEVIGNKLQRRNTGEAVSHHYLITCQHPHVFTLGRNGSERHLLISQQALQQRGIGYYRINRGGDITYHGPGQLVCYPILDLDLFFTDIGRYLRLLEESVICTLSEYGITAGRSKGETGVWLHAESPSRARKICAIGVRCSRWVTMHGLAFNINTDLEYFRLIVPCGITNKGVTSLEKELGHPVPVDEVKEKWLRWFGRLFHAEVLPATGESSIRYAQGHHLSAG
ncbi:MAG: lipoyl(octanoyl) transferase LipB [Chitinophagales bacterium]|nr:lipoyl(octanoyl) transferase LipB [Chitinophagales bacterium]MDW8393380.1 lipoyl(octanoyl) transferase LipB [Chitinophagales bacterium]